MSSLNRGRTSAGRLRSLLGAATILISAFSLAHAAPGNGKGNGNAPEHAGVPQQVIVQFAKPGQGQANRSDRANEVLAAVSQRLSVKLERVRELGTGADLIRVNGKKGDRERVAQMLSKNPHVVYAEVDRMLQPLATPNDSRYSEQWHYFESTGGLNADTAWDSVNGNGVRVAVIDTGYRPHADLNGNIVGGYDFISDSFVGNDGDGRDSDARDPGDWTDVGECGNGQPTQFRGSSWHGTHVAGTVAAETNNNSGVAGVAYGAQVVPLRVLGKCGGLTSDIADAIIWAAGGSVSGVPSNNYPAQVINMSLGGGGSCSSTTQSAINSARSNGAVVVVAAGNSNTNASNANPANCNGVVTVASTNRDGGRAYYSNYGSVVDVAAPGGELTQSTSVNGVLSTHNSGTTTPGSDNYSFLQGTSMASPHVAGVAALMLEADPSLTPDQVESTLKNTTRSFPSTCSQCGTGIVDAAAAVSAVSGGGGGGGGGATVLENGVAETGLSGAQGAELDFTMDVPAGATDLSFVMSGGSGDADLYVKFGSEPTTSSYDCRPYVGGNDETCDISNVQEGTYYVMIRGYSSFSSVSLVGSYTEDTGGGGGGTGSCPAGYTQYTGTLTGSGDEEFEPDGTYYYSGTSGTHAGELTGASGTDFDLYLRKWNGSGWSNVRSGTSSDSNESVSYSGTSGYYVWRVYSYSGSGDYNFCMKKP